MSQVQLRRLDPMCNMARFYVIDVQQDLFGGWWLVRERGRIDSPGRVLTTPFPHLDAAARHTPSCGQRRSREATTAIGSHE